MNENHMYFATEIAFCRISKDVIQFFWKYQIQSRFLNRLANQLFDEWKKVWIIENVNFLNFIPTCQLVVGKQYRKKIYPLAQSTNRNIFLLYIFPFFNISKSGNQIDTTKSYEHICEVWVEKNLIVFMAS